MVKRYNNMWLKKKKTLNVTERLAMKNAQENIWREKKTRARLMDFRTSAAVNYYNMYNNAERDLDLKRLSGVRRSLHNIIIYNHNNIRRMKVVLEFL